MDSGQLSFCLSWPMQDAGSHGANKSEEVKVTLTQKFAAVHLRFFRGSVDLNETVFTLTFIMCYEHVLSYELRLDVCFICTYGIIERDGLQNPLHLFFYPFVHVLFLSTFHALTSFVYSFYSCSVV